MKYNVTIECKKTIVEVEADNPNIAEDIAMDIFNDMQVIKITATEKE